MTNGDIFIILAACGLVIGLSPGVISIFTALIASAFGKGLSKLIIAGMALTFIETLLFFYVALTAVIIFILDSFSNSTQKYIGLMTGLILVSCGIYNIVLSYIQDSNTKRNRHFSSKLHEQTVKQVSVSSIIWVALASPVKTPSLTLVPIIGVSVMLAILNSAKIGIISIMPLAIILSLVVITIMALNGVKLSAIMKWKNDNATTFHTWAGIITIILGWLLWLIINGSVVTSQL